MKWIAYNLLFLVAYPFMLPSFLVRMLRRGGYAARMGDRFAIYPEAVLRALGRRDSLSDSHSLSHGDMEPGEFVWVHAVSVGEVRVAGRLMREWRSVERGVRFCFSTTSSTGWKAAESEITDRDILIYNPVDFPSFVKSALLAIRPRALVLTESEIWPNLVRLAARAGIPTFLVNARVSDRSAPRYRAARLFFGDVFRSFSGIFAQSDLDADRIRAAAPGADNISVCGSFKFDAAERNEAKEGEMREWIFAGAEGDARPRLLLGGSTWPGEDVALLKIYKRLLESSKAPSGILLAIAPRHFEKADAVEANIKAAGFRCIRRSRGERAVGGPAVVLADTTGELMGLYGVADAVFVGKSLCAHGSQNMIEPCLCGKPTFVGPYTENFRPVMADLLSSGAIVQVKDEAELGERIEALFADGGASAGELGGRARSAVERRRGVVARCVAEMRRTL